MAMLNLSFRHHRLRRVYPPFTNAISVRVSTWASIHRLEVFVVLGVFYLALELKIFVQ